MNLRRFVDAAFTLLVEEFQRAGGGLIDAIDRVNRLGLVDAPDPKVPDAHSNAQAMQTLMGAMAGVKGSPV